MNGEEFAHLVDALDDILDEEREALLSGDLEKIGRLLERKEALIDELSDLDAADAGALQSLQDKLNRNQGLLDSALEGIRAVAGRLAAFRRVRTKLETYDSKGAKRSIDMAQDGALEKRA